MKTPQEMAVIERTFTMPFTRQNQAYLSAWIAADVLR